LSFRHDPANSLGDIIDNAARIADYIHGLDQHRFERDRLIRDAVERCLERVCEAAFRLGTNADALAPNQPCGQIRGLGNQLRHGYDRINVEIIWNTASERLPELAAVCSQALARLEAERSAAP
jgi:uncharacterized protein with HEPN domain